MLEFMLYSKTCLTRKTKIGFQDRLSLNEGQKYYRMLRGGGHSVTLSTFIKFPFVIKIFVLFIFEWPLKTRFSILNIHYGSTKIPVILGSPIILSPTTIITS